MVNVILTPGLPEAVPETAGSTSQTGAETGETGFADALLIALGLSGGQEPQGLSLPIGVPLPVESEDEDAEPQAEALVQIAMVPAVGPQCPQLVLDQAVSQPEALEIVAPVQPAPTANAGTEINQIMADSGTVAPTNPQYVDERGEVPAADVLLQLEPVEPEVALNVPVPVESVDDSAKEQVSKAGVESDTAVPEAEQVPQSGETRVAQDTAERRDSDRVTRFRPESSAPRTFGREVRHWASSTFNEQTQAARPEPRPTLTVEQGGPVESASQSLRRSSHVAAEPAPPPDPVDRARPAEAPRVRLDGTAPVQPFTEVRADVDADVNGRNGEAPLPSVAAAAGQPATPEAARADFSVVRQTEQAPRTEQHTRVIEQIVREVQLSQSDGRRDIVVRLNPPELGTLRLQISQDMSGMTSHIQASTDQVRGLLQAHVPALIEALSTAGVRVDAVSVSSGPMFGAFAQDTAGNAYTRQEQQRRTTANRQTAGGVDAPAAFAARQAQPYQAGYSWLA